MVENFCASFGAATKKLLDTSSTPTGTDILKIFKEVIKTCLDENKIIYQFGFAEWNGKIGTIVVNLKFVDSSNIFTQVYSIVVRRNADNTFQLTGNNAINADHTFDITGKHEEINSNLVKKLMLKLVNVA